jgi:hypothetical protein
MHTEHKREEPLVDLGYEIRDIDYKGLGKATIFFMAFVLFSFGSVGFWFSCTKPQIASTLDPHKPVPTILLQSNIAVRSDIQTFRKHETEMLTKGGTNPDGSARIPIEQAMEIIASKGLAPTRTQIPAISPHNTIPQNALPPGETAPPPADMSSHTSTTGPGGTELSGDIGTAPVPAKGVTP